MDNIKHNYFLSKLDDNYLLVAECFIDNIYYSVHFLIKDNKFSQFWSFQSKSTLNEPVTTTLARDFYRIYLKIKYILNIINMNI